jgi:MOSC domain-containing protein YiiM
MSLRDEHISRTAGVEMTTGKLLAICVGTPTDYGKEGAQNPFDRPWRTSFYKYPVDGARWMGTTNIEGDAQADTKAHGGPEKAVLAYSADHYALWKKELPDVELGYGGFAENLDIAGLSESTVCLGDSWQIGDAVVQVSQARQPCWKISRRWRVPDFALRVQQTGRTGWYLRVLHEGEIAAGLDITLLERPHPDWTIARCNEVMHVQKNDRNLAAELASIPELALSWRKTLEKRAESGKNPDPETRLVGSNRD